MSGEHPVRKESLETLTGRALAALREGSDGMAAWANAMRESPGRFRWAAETTRCANIAATSYLIGGLTKMGLIDRVLTAEDYREGLAWVLAMRAGGGQFHDPALLGRRTPGWPDDRPWPDSAMLLGVSQYAGSVLAHYSRRPDALLPAQPPPGWPQAEDGPEKALEFIRTRPYAESAWGACSHAMRMATWLLHWRLEGRISLDPLIEALRFFFSIQDERTGLWGSAAQPKFVRINGTFKLFPLIREELDLPLPHAEKIIDQVLEEFYRPDYDETVGACDEWDNWYVLALAREEAAAGYREDEIQKMAAHRIARTLEIFRKPDGGLSYSPQSCVTNWIGFDMAPELPQSDVMGPGILACGINVCIDLLGLRDATEWTGEWRMRQRQPAELLDRIREQVFGDEKEKAAC